MNYQEMLADSRRLRESALRAAEDGYRRVAACMPALALAELRKMKIRDVTAETLALAEAKVEHVLTDAAAVRDRAVLAAHEQDNDRRLAAAMYYHQGLDAPGNPHAAHAQQWLKENLT